MARSNPARGARANQQLSDENERLKAQLLQARAIAAQPSTRSSGATEEDKKWKTDVHNAVKKLVWGKVKFCKGDEKLAVLTSGLCDRWDLKEKENLADDAAREAHKLAFIAENKDHCAHWNERSPQLCPISAASTYRGAFGGWSGMPHTLRSGKVRGQEQGLLGQSVQPVDHGFLHGHPNF